MFGLDAVQSLWPFGRPPDGRSEQQIEDDLDAEFAFHLDMKTRELMGEGHSPQAARDLAQTQFGNIEQIKKRCKKIASEERTMLKRIHLALTILLALALAVTVYVAVSRIARERDLAMQNRALAEQARVDAEREHARAEATHDFLTSMITANDPERRLSPTSAKEVLDKAAQQIDTSFADDPQMQKVLRSAIERARSESMQPLSSTSPGLIYVDGFIARPGTYALPVAGQLTLKRLLAAAGGITDETDTYVMVNSLVPNSGKEQRYLTAADVHSPDSPDYNLYPGDLIIVAKTRHLDSNSAQP